MDLLEVFLQRRIQPLQACDHPMWLYSGLDDTTRVHPEEVTDEMLEGWLSSITGNKDNPRGARRVVPLDNTYEVDQATTEMYSTPNGAQEPTEEGEASGGESGDEQVEWESDGEGEGDDVIDSSEEEEEEVEPPRPEGRSKLTDDPARERGKATAPVGQSSKRPRTSSPTPTEKAPKHPRATPSKPPKALPKMKMTVPTISGAATSELSAKDDDQEMEDAVTSNPAPPHVIILSDDDDNEPLRMRRSRRALAGKTPQSALASEVVAQDGGETTRASVTFVVPLTSVRPSKSTADPPSLFATHHVPEEQAAAAREAIHQAGIMMEQVKVAREASQAAYDASSALQSNVQKSCELVAHYTELENKQIQLDLNLKLAQENLKKAQEEAKDKLEKALKKKDQALVEAQKEALNKTKLAEEKLASVGTLEQENSRLKAALEVANQEVNRLKNDNVALHDKAGELAGKRNDLEAYLSGLAKKLFVMLEGNYSDPTVLQLPSLCRATVLFLNRVCRILPELQRGNQSSGARLGPRQFSREGRGCYERAPTGVLCYQCC
ncbi:hypothetical protein VPH35_068606 [Triticum aestivum]